jgi:putative membrane protein
MWFLDGSWGMHDGMGWWMLWGGLMMALFWGAIIGFIAWLVTRLPGQRTHDSGSALDIAQRRYASGEISREEFEQIRGDLTSRA